MRLFSLLFAFQIITVIKRGWWIKYFAFMKGLRKGRTSRDVKQTFSNASINGCFQIIRVIPLIFYRSLFNYLQNKQITYLCPWMQKLDLFTFNFVSFNLMWYFCFYISSLSSCFVKLRTQILTTPLGIICCRSHPRTFLMIRYRYYYSICSHLYCTIFND